MSRAKSFLRLTQFIGVGMFAYILANLNLGNVVDQLKEIRFQWLLVYIAFFTISMSAKGLRWNVILKAQKSGIPARRVVAIAFVASFIGAVTPGRIGEVSKIVYLREDKMTVPKATVSVVLDRFYDIVFLIVFGLAGLAYFSSFFLPSLLSLALIAALVVGGLGLIMVARKRIWDLLKIFAKRIFSTEMYSSLTEGWETFKFEMVSVAPTTAPSMLLYSTVVHLAFFGQTYVLALGLGISVPFVYLSLCLAISSLITLLPISIGGLGTREATFVALLGKISIPPESAVLISFSDGVVLGLSLAALFALVGSWYLKAR